MISTNMNVIALDHYCDEHGDQWPLPARNNDSAGFDLRAAISTPVTLQPMDDVVIPSGLKIHIGSHEANEKLGELIGIYGFIAPRSGLGFKHYVRLANTTGIIDSDYQGEIMIKIRNEGNTELTINPGDRICQMIFHLYLKEVNFVLVDSFDKTRRGGDGFGSSGVK